MITGSQLLLAGLSLLAVAYATLWWALERGRGEQARRFPGLGDVVLGLVTNFFDTLGIGSFAPTTALFKLRRRPPDEEIPGTLNAGHALPTLAQGLIFIALVTVDFTTLVGMISASVVGSWFGAGVVSRLPRRAIQAGMGMALLIAAGAFVATNLHWMPGGGAALGLHGSALAVAIGINGLLGALMTLGVGLYAPCLILVSLLGMNPLAAFPIMMGSCAFLMPIGGLRFIWKGRYNLPAALGLTLGGLPGVLIAAFIVKSLPIVWLRWLVVVVVVYAAILMLLSARRPLSGAGALRGSARGA
jgi:uncharacterized membrane protein YfcA